MFTASKILRRVLIVIIALLIVGLAAFYVFLKQKQTAVGNGAERVYGTDAPSLGNSTESPHGSNVSNTASPRNKAEAVESPSKTSRLLQVTKSPVAGMGFNGSANSSNLLFTERSSGYIRQEDVRTGTVTRLTNKLLPKVYEAIFSRGRVIIRSVDENGNVTSFVAAMATSSTSRSTHTISGISSSSTPDTPAEQGGASAFLNGQYIENNIATLSVNQKTDEMFYLRRESSGLTVGVRVPASATEAAVLQGAKQKTVFSSLISNWISIFLPDGRIFLTLKPSDNISGYAYELKGDGLLSPQLLDVPGLTYLPQTSSTAILFGSSQSGELKLYARARDDATIISLPLKTIADKCVWAPTNASQNVLASKALIAYCAVPQYIPSKKFLDDWHRGAIHTSDDWWRINASDGTVELLYSPGDTGVSIDVENPIIDDKGETIAFMNALDKTLWLLSIDLSAQADAPKNPASNNPN